MVASLQHHQGMQRVHVQARVQARTHAVTQAGTHQVLTNACRLELQPTHLLRRRTLRC
jgi:hypothetical protein